MSFFKSFRLSLAIGWIVNDYRLPARRDVTPVTTRKGSGEAHFISRNSKHKWKDVGSVTSWTQLCPLEVYGLKPWPPGVLLFGGGIPGGDEV